MGLITESRRGGGETYELLHLIEGNDLKALLHACFLVCIRNAVNVNHNLQNQGMKSRRRKRRKSRRYLE